MTSKGLQTIIIPVNEEAYMPILDRVGCFKNYIDSLLSNHPELFPKSIFKKGYVLDGYSRCSEKIPIKRRVIQIKEKHYIIHPCFVMPYLRGQAEGYLLIDDKTGEIILTKGYPKAANDYEHIACLNPDWGDKGNFRGIQLFGYVDNEITLIFEEELEAFRPILPKWVDENTLQFILLDIGDKRNRKSRYGQLIKNENGEWELEL